MADKQWAGLITNASPYSLPEGAAVEQTNLSSAIPGQLTSRGGMRPVSFSAGSLGNNGVLDFHLYVFGNSNKLIALMPGGNVVAVTSPSYGSAPSSPSNPTLSPSSNQVQSSYTGTFYDAAGEPPA